MSRRLYVSDYPNLMEEWDWDKNNRLGLNPEKLAHKSNKKVWWQCSKGHSWLASIYHRMSTQNCPYCSNHRVLIGYNDLGTVYPNLVKEWDDEKNEKKPEQYSIGSAQKVWWRCSECGCEWETSIRQRTQKGTGCPKCAVNKISKKRKKAILEKKGGIINPVLLKEWNYKKNGSLSPQEITEGSGQAVWWRCQKCGYEWKAKISNRAIGGRGCPCCANKVVVIGKNDLATTHPQIAKEWDFISNGNIFPTSVTYGQAKKVYWICPNGHRYQATILHRTSGTNCPICISGRQTSFAEQAFYFYIKKLYPDALNRYTEIFNNGMELDIFIPSIKTAIEYDGVFWHKYKRNSDEKKYAICKNNGIKLIRIRESEDYDSQGIADESFHIKDMDNINNLEKLIIVLLEKLKNNNSNYLKDSFEVNLIKDNFEIRKYMTELRKNSFADVRPDLVKEWCDEKNGGLTPKMFLPNSSQKVWWKCEKCGNTWQAAIAKRTTGTSCPICYRRNNRSKNHSEAKQIFQYSKEGIFIKAWDCISDACRELKINSSNISMCAKHQRRIAGGFRWEYYCVEKLTEIEPIKKHEKGSWGKEILQINDEGKIIAEYKSLNEAAEKMCVDASSISKVIHGHTKKAGGFYWRLK